MGLGRFGGGVAAARFLSLQGALVTVTDLRSADELADSLDKLRELPVARYALNGHPEDVLTDCQMLVVNPAVKANSVQDLVALAKAQPGKLTCASSGSGSTIHMSCEMFKQKMGVDIAHVPYKGSGPAIADLLGGHVNIMFDNIPSAIPHIRSGKLRALATTGGKRDATLTDLPTMAEAGVAGYESTVWFGLVAPAATPKDVVDRLNAAGRQAAKAPDFSKRLSDLGYGIVGDTSPEQMASMIQDEVRRWGPIVKASGARID